MAVDMFLELGDIEGDSKDAVYEGKIDILSWAWGMTQSGTTHSGPGGGAGKVDVQDISITKNIDKASPNIIKVVCTGKALETARLICRKAGEEALEYLVIEMEQVIVSSYSVGGSEGEIIPTENFSLNFAKFTLTYTPQMDDGSGDAEIPVGLNIPTGEVS